MIRPNKELTWLNVQWLNYKKNVTDWKVNKTKPLTIIHSKTFKTNYEARQFENYFFTWIFVWF
jgi:hypothetical protein